MNAVGNASGVNDGGEFIASFDVVGYAEEVEAGEAAMHECRKRVEVFAVMLRFHTKISLSLNSGPLARNFLIVSSVPPVLFGEAQAINHSASRAM